MKKFFKNEGFTLVELIVVIAILGILAAVAVPAYTGYVEKANDSAVVTELAAIKTAADAIAAEQNTAVETITVDKTGDVDVTFEDTADDSEIGTYYEASAGFDDNMGKSASYKNGAVWNAAKGWQPGTGSGS